MKIAITFIFLFTAFAAAADKADNSTNTSVVIRYISIVNAMANSKDGVIPHADLNREVLISQLVNYYYFRGDEKISNDFKSAFKSISKKLHDFNWEKELTAFEDVLKRDGDKEAALRLQLLGFDSRVSKELIKHDRGDFLKWIEK